MSKFTKFWDWFVSKSEYIYSHLETDTDDIALEITEQIKKINEDIEFEIPFDLKENKRTLIISADGLEELFELVTMFVSKAPKINKWNIIAFRPRLHQRNQIIDLEGITMDYDDIYFQYTIEGNQINVDVYIKNYDGKDNRYVHLYFLLLDSLIGEYDSVMRIKETRTYPFKNKKNLLVFKELLSIIDTLKT